MQCSSCRTENPESARFCIECGTAFAKHCAQCGQEAPARARFCGQCGASFAVPPEPAVREPRTVAAVAEGERRHLTVLFCDLVDSTKIAAHLDPEQWHDIAAHYQRMAAEAVTKAGGHVAKYLGDGLVVYFGYPEAQEDAAERAVRAGLAILEGMTALNARFSKHAITLQVRVGIHAGSVVVAHGGGKDADMFGDAPNVASRVQTAAEPDTLMITSAVHDLVSGLFVVSDGGSQQLKGIDQPMRLYRVVSPGLASGRGRAFSARDPTPFIGRGDEQTILMSRWERVRAGEGQLVLVMGEPGIGKTRLMEEFRSRIKGEPHLWIECAGAPFFAATPFHAVTQMLHQGLGWLGDESPEERFTRLERGIERTRMKPGEAIPLIAEMLNLPIPDKYPPLNFAPDQRRKRLLAALTEWVFSATLPLVIEMEDLHWVDPSTLELLQTLAEQGATAPLMLLCTARPEFRTPWPMRAHHAQITLNRLSTRETRELVTGVMAHAGLATDVLDAVIKRTDGVPLFAEELTRLMLEGQGRTGVHEIPTTLLDSLGARLDRLGQAKEIAQLGAVLGREFSYELLAAISPVPEDMLQAALAKLADSELIYVRGLPPEASYQFKHALIQDAAYEALLKTRRLELHGRVAQTIVEKFPEIAETQPQVLARHWTEGGHAKPAIAAWMKAAKAADARRALGEAEECYRQALKVLETLESSPERDALELELVSALVPVLVYGRGYSAQETVEIVKRASLLSGSRGDLGQVCQLLFGMFQSALASGDNDRTKALADQLMEIATKDGNQKNLLAGHQAQLYVCVGQLDLAHAEDHFAKWSEICGAIGFDASFSVHGAIGIAIRSAGWAGLSDEARKRLAMAVQIAQTRKTPFDLAIMLYWNADAQALVFNDLHACEEACTKGIALYEQYDIPKLWLSGLRAYKGWARAQLGDHADGIKLIRQGIASMNEVHHKYNLPTIYGCLGSALFLNGSVDEALEAFDVALEANPSELAVRPLVLSWSGDMHAKLGNSERAESQFREALDLARKAQAKALELRAALSLARLWQSEGKREEAREVLAPVFGWFAGDPSTLNLKEAEALLKELD